MLVTGRSLPGPCGVRDYAETLAAGLGGELLWVDEPTPRSFAAALRADVRYLRRLAAATPRGGAVVVNYSPFAMSWRGVPLLVPFAAWVVRRRGGRAVVVLHELVYDWGRSGARGLAWALSQRLALLPLATGAAALVVTTDRRGAWVRRWLRRRPAVVPVWSSMPREGRPAPRGAAPLLGCFGWGAVGPRERVLALDALAGIGRDARLVLVGGLASSPMRTAWYADAAARGLGDRLDATGPLEPDGVAAQLLALDVYLHLDDVGPVSRKSSLATALGLGLAIVATDGRETWRVLRDTGAVRVVPPRAADLVSAVESLLDEPAERTALQARALACYDAQLSFDRALAAYRRLVA